MPSKTRTIALAAALAVSSANAQNVITGYTYPRSTQMSIRQSQITVQTNVIFSTGDYNFPMNQIGGGPSLGEYSGRKSNLFNLLFALPSMLQQTAFVEDHPKIRRIITLFKADNVRIKMLRK